MSGEHAAKRFDSGAFAGTRHTGDAEADGFAAIRQTAFDYLLSLELVVVERALDQRDGTGEHGAVAMEDARDELVDRDSGTTRGTCALDIVAAHLFGLRNAVHDVESRLVFEIAVEMTIVRHSRID